MRPGSLSMVILVALKAPLPTPTPSKRPSSSETVPWPPQGRHAVRARHGASDGHRPEPAQTVGTSAVLIDAADLPLVAVSGVVRAVLVDAGAENRMWRSLRGITNTPQTV